VLFLLVQDDDDKQPEDIDLPTGCIMQITEISPNVTREDLKAAVQEKCEVTVAFIDFSKGDKEAWVRLAAQGAATKVSTCPVQVLN
jgi:hypothetical protein